MLKITAHRLLRVVILTRVLLGPGVWMVALSVAAVLLFAAVFTPSSSVLLPVFAAALILLALVADELLRRPVVRLFNPALASLVDEILNVFDGKGAGAWNNGVLRARYHAALVSMRDAVHLVLGRNAYSSNTRALLEALADKLLAQGGDWAEVRSELLKLRGCAVRGEVGSPRCAPVSQKEAADKKRPLWEGFRKALPGLLTFAALAVDLLERLRGFLGVQWP